MTIVISLGGSIVAPQEGPSGLFLLQFRNVLLSWLEAENRKAIICGWRWIRGPSVAESLQGIYRASRREGNKQ